MTERTEERKHAIVIGGSIAGLLAARVLSDYFEKVTILERDRLPDSAEARRGVPQGRHAHAMLAGGFRVVNALFPEVCEELGKMGAFPADAQRDGNWYMEGGLLDRSPVGSYGMMSSRLLLEQAIRRLTLHREGIELREESPVRELIVENGRIKGVLTESGEILADLVVDSSGRGSKAPRWLEALGYTAPKAEEVEIQLVYTTRRFRRRSDDPDLFSVVPPTPEGKRGGVILAQENNEWMCTLFGHFGQQAPEDLEGFLDYAKSLSASYIYDAIRDAEPIGEPSIIRFPASIRRRYEELDRFPEGLLVFGDAICSFNPIYGQGMSVAALEAEALGAELAKGYDGLAKRFFGAAAKIIDNPWKIAVGGDLKMPEVHGPRPLSVRLINWYVGKLHECGHTDAAAARAFIRVQQLLDPPEALMHPRIVVRVLRSMFGASKAGKRREYNAPPVERASLGRG